MLHYAHPTMYIHAHKCFSAVVCVLISRGLPLALFEEEQRYAFYAMLVTVHKVKTMEFINVFLQQLVCQE